MERFFIENYQMDDLDREIIKALQGGLELSRRPYAEVALCLDITEEEVCRRLEQMHSVGFVRKNAVATNQYKLGYTFNAMTVWNVKKGEMDQVGKRFSDLGFISHCYERPQIENLWSYNLFAMIHAKNEADMEEKIRLMKIAGGQSVIEMNLIISTEILKKTGIRLGDI